MESSQEDDSRGSSNAYSFGVESRFEDNEAVDPEKPRKPERQSAKNGPTGEASSTDYADNADSYELHV